MASVSQVCSLWQHIESQEYYAYLAQGKMKVDGQWVECTVYRQCKTGELFVRPRTEFAQKFVFVTTVPTTL